MAHIAETGVRKRKMLNSQYINEIGIYENDRVTGVGALAAFGISESGTLAYFAGDGSAAVGNPSSLIWVDRQGGEQPIAAPPGVFNSGPRLSPDGGRVALELFDLLRLAVDI